MGFVSGLAREVACQGVAINNLLPGNFGTERLQGYAAKVGAQRGQSAAEVLCDMASKTPVGRIGRPEEFGAWCAFLASEHSGYVTAQNFVLDGGSSRRIVERPSPGGEGMKRHAIRIPLASVDPYV